MDDLRDLYQTTILDHNKRPQNFRVMEAPNRQQRDTIPFAETSLISISMSTQRTAFSTSHFRERAAPSPPHPLR